MTRGRPIKVDKMTQAERKSLRYAAGLHYTLESGPMGLRTLQRWATEDEWSQRRQANLDRWRNILTQKVGDRLLQGRVQRMGQMERIYGHAMDMLERDVLQPKSWEAVAQVALRTSQQMDEFQQSMLNQIVTPLDNDKQPLPAHVLPTLSPAEVRAAAAAIVAVRANRYEPQPMLLGQGRERYKDSEGRPLKKAKAV
jgi:hypothetical protein